MRWFKPLGYKSHSEYYGIQAFWKFHGSRLNPFLILSNISIDIWNALYNSDCKTYFFMIHIKIIYSLGKYGIKNSSLRSNRPDRKRVLSRPHFVKANTYLRYSPTHSTLTCLQILRRRLNKWFSSTYLKFPVINNSSAFHYLHCIYHASQQPSVTLLTDEASKKKLLFTVQDR